MTLSAALLVVLSMGQDVRELIGKLRSEQVEERDAAYRSLKKLGRPALPELEKAAADADVEVSRRIRRLIRVIPLYEQAPGFEERLADGGEHEWTVLFLEQASQEPADRPGLDRLAAGALRAAVDSQEAHRVCEYVEAYKLRSAVPALLAFLKRPESEYRYEGVATLARLGVKEAVPAILPLLGDPAEDVRAWVYDVILQFRVRSELPRLPAGLKDPSNRARNSAARALGMLAGEDQRPDLVAALSHDDPSVRSWIAGGLGRLGGRSAVSPLLPLLRDPESYVRLAAVEALARIGETEAVPGLRASLKDSEPEVAVAAIEALVGMDAPDAEREIYALTRHPESKTRRKAFEALAQLEARSRISDLLQRLDDPEPDVRYGVLKLLTDLRARSALPEALKLTEDPDRDVRWYAVQMLSLFRDVRAVPALRARLKDEATFNRIDAARLLGELGGREAIPDLIAILDDGEEGVRRAGVRALGELRATEALGTLTKMLDDPNGLVADEAVEALDRMGARDVLLKAFREGKAWPSIAGALVRLTPEKVPGLLDELFQDGRPQALHGAIQLLRSLPANSDRLIPLLKSEDGDLRWAAIEAAVALGRKEAIPELLEFMKRPESFFHFTAIHGLKALGAREALDAIRPALNGEHWLIRSLAVDALVALGGKDVRPDLQALSNDPSSDLRANAYAALGKLGFSDDVRRGLLDHDAQVRWTSVEALEAMDAKEAASDVARLLGDEHGYTRFAAARALCSWGRTEGRPAILKENRRLASLNGLRQGEPYGRLRRTRMEDVLEGNAKENLDRIAARAGLKVELAPGAAGENELPLHRPKRLDGREEKATLLSALEHSLEPRYEIVLEPDRIRVLSRLEARRFWKEWAARKE